MDKVKFNLHNVHYAVYDADTGKWEKPVAIPGAVSMTLSPEGDVSKFYADGILYYMGVKNNGYTGELEMALFPAHFLKSVLGVSEGAESKVLTENANTEAKEFALLFEEDGDTDGTRFAAYSCTATRPSRSLSTTEGDKKPTTQKINLTIRPLADGRVLAMTQEDTPSDVKAAWYDSVFEETA